MATWRCPFCGTPQAETARCWVCHRSTTACATCRHFRKAVAVQMGYCGLDRRRTPLNGQEQRACWEGVATAGSVPPGEGDAQSRGEVAGYGLWGSSSRGRDAGD